VWGSPVGDFGPRSEDETWTWEPLAPVCVMPWSISITLAEYGQLGESETVTIERCCATSLERNQMDDIERWAAEKADEINKRKEKEQAAKQAEAGGAAKIAQVAPQLWSAVRTAIEEQAKALNKKLAEPYYLAVKCVGDNLVQVQTPNGELSVAKFNPETYQLGMSTSLNNYSFPPEIRGNVVAFCMGARGQQMTEISIAQLFLGEVASKL
jgi:hypothetical protein